MKLNRWKYWGQLRYLWRGSTVGKVQKAGAVWLWSSFLCFWTKHTIYNALHFVHTTGISDFTMFRCLEGVRTSGLGCVCSQTNTGALCCGVVVAQLSGTVGRFLLCEWMAGHMQGAYVESWLVMCLWLLPLLSVFIFIMSCLVYLFCVFGAESSAKLCTDSKCRKTFEECCSYSSDVLLYAWQYFSTVCVFLASPLSQVLF